MREQALNAFDNCRAKFFEDNKGPQTVMHCAAFPFGIKLISAELQSPGKRANTATKLGCAVCPFAKDVFAITVTGADGRSINFTPVNLSPTQTIQELPNNE